MSKLGMENITFILHTECIEGEGTQRATYLMSLCKWTKEWGLEK